MLPLIENSLSTSAEHAEMGSTIAAILAKIGNLSLCLPQKSKGSHLSSDSFVIKGTKEANSSRKGGTVLGIPVSLSCNFMA